MKERLLTASVILYVASSLIDNLLTYWLVVVEGRFLEANLFATPFIYMYPLYMWFVRGAAFFTLALAAAHA